MANNNNDWRSKVKSMMTDPNYAKKMASAVDTTRKINTDLMNKSAENYPALSLTQPTQKPLDLRRVEDIKAEEVARATMPTEGDAYSGVADLATKLYAEERDRRGKEAMQRIADDKSAAFASPMATAINRVAEIDKATNVGQTYDAVMKNETLIGAVRANANKALVKALEQNQSMTEEEQQKVYEDAVKKQMEGIESKVNEYLLSVNAPKSEAEYIAKSAINNSIIGKAVQGAARAVAGDGGEFGYEQQALADYDQNKATWWGQGLGVAAGLALDAPIMQGIGMGVNATIGRGTMWGLSRIGGKALQSSLLGKVAMGMSTGGGVLGGYNAVSTLQSQLMGGYFNPSEIASSTGHGILLGGLTGGMTPWLRGVSANMGKVGKVGTMAGGLATEAGIFTASELSEMDNPYDIETIAKALGKNVAVIGGLKVSNLPKTISEYKGWYNEGKQSNFSDADYKVMADFAKANGYANEEAFTMSADGTYKRSIADRVTGNRTLLEMTKLQGGKEHRLAIDMFSDPNVPLSLKTKIAAKMGWQAPSPVLANGVRVEGNKAITYYTLPDGRQQVIDIKEFPRPRNARAFANEFGRTTARRNDLLQSEAFANEMASEPIILARLNEQAKRNGTSLEEEAEKIDAIFQRYKDGTITKEDVAYYNSIYEGDATATDAIKETIKAEQGVDIDEVLRKEGSFTDAEDKALTAYSNALRDIIEKGNPTTERMAVASTAGVADYVVLNNLDIMQTSELMANPTKRAEVDAQMRGKYAAWLKFFDGKMGEDALAERLGYNLDNTSDLQSFLAEQTYFKTKAADRIASRTVETAKAMLENGGNGVRFTEDGKVKLKGVPYAVEVSEDIVGRYEAAMNGSGEPMSRIVNDALKDIIKQGETPVASKEPIAEEATMTEQPMTENEAITQQMVDARLAEIDTDLQGIQADGVQKMTINGQRAMVVKGRIVADINGQVDKTKSSTEVAYMLLDENGRPMLDENGRPKIEVGVKPSNVRVEDVEPWRRVDEYKASEEQRIRENNRITDEAMRQADEQMAVEESKAEQIVEPQTTEEMLQLCNGDKELAIDVATDELNRAMQSKGKGATPAETMEINKRIRMYQQMLNELSRPEQPVEAPKEQVEEPQVTEDMEFIYQQGLDENHDGMEPMQTTDGRYKWVGLQRGELTANMGERDVELLDNLAKKLGVAVIPINVEDRAVNGYYRDGNIYVNTNRGAEWTMRWVAGHEMLHDVANKSTDAYNAYKQAVLDMWGEEYVENQVKQIIEDYKASGKTIDREQALTELVNDFGGELFNSRDGLGILDNILKTESSKGNVGFVDTIKQWWEKLKEWFSGTPYYSEIEKKLADAYESAMKVMADRMGERKIVEQQELVAIGGLKDEAVVDDAISNEGAEMSIVRDRNKIGELESEELVPMLRTFQVFDGRLYPPMAAVQGGKKVHSVMVGDWWKSDENPDKVEVKIKGSKAKTGVFSKDDDRISKKDGQWVITIDGEDKPLSMREDGSLAYYFNLKKGEKGDEVSDDLDVAYNPYIHMSKSALNDQFKGAYLRPNLVLVEVLAPKSEIDGTNRYRADYAKDGIGIVSWNSGDVIKQAVAAGHPGREVALSRYAKIGRVFTNAEWADRIDAELAPYKDKIVLPFIMFPPEVLRGLADKGYKIEPPTSKKAQPYYEKWLKGEQPTDPNGGGGKPVDAEFSVKADKQKQLDIINRTNPAHDDYHTWIRTTDDIKTLQEAVDEVKAEDADYNLSTYPDVTDNMINEALQTGKITIYSSKPIKEGAFVSPSKMQAKDYAGGDRIYSKQVPINDVAWINTDEGMFAPVEFSVKDKQADESVLDYAKRVSEENANSTNGDADYSIKRGGKTLEERLNSKRMQTRLNAAKELGKDYPEVDNILNDLEPSDINEVVAATLGSPNFKLRWEDKTGSKGLQKHLGLSDAEKKGFRSMISSNGYTPEEAAHQIWRNLSEEIAGKTGTMEILGIVLDYARSYTKRELREMIANNRIDTAIDYARKQAEWDAAQEQIYLEGLTEAERNAYLANKAEQEKIANMTEKQKAKYFEELQRKQMLDAMTPEERAEYEAKEKWRKENAGAIASSFFAERRADKADKIQALKDQINKLIRDTRAAKSEDSAKVKEIAKKMREFIEESIPTKNQDDMTRTQFEQVLKQLANATTRKQLEEPMRMIDYIGTNVNRRALTRQMEDFLKKGFRGMTPKGLVKAKMVDGATSRVLGLAKSLYSAMSKTPLGSELRALQTNVRGIKAELEEYNEKNGGQYQEYVDQIDAILKKSGVDRHEEMVKYHNELLTKENTGEVLDYVGRLLPELFNIELVKEQRKDAKISSALNTKEDLEQLKNSLADKEEKGILSEEDKAVMDNISLYELMIDLHQRQLDIDGPGASSIASQMVAKIQQVKEWRKKLSEAEEGSKTEAKLKMFIEQTEAEIDELFVQRTQAQKDVNTNTEELLTNLKELRDDGISKLQEWSKAKKERETQIVTMANESFGEDARGYWSEVDRKGKGKRDFVNWLKNQKLAFLMSPAMSFEYMLGVMDPRYYTNESPIYKQFIKGSEGLIKANDNFFVGLESYNQGINEAVDKFIGRTAMTNLKDYFKKGDRYATEIIPFAFEVGENKNGEIVKTLVPTEKEMTRGQAAKIYAWSRMVDGMAKLKAHGVTDKTMEKVMEFIGEDYMNFIDWVEDVYFPKLRRERYNPIYKQMYGISMAENEHYFPFLIYQKDVRTEQELEQPSNDKLGGGVVGNLVERKQNNARLDFTAKSPDIFDMITDYGKKMEEWAAYAQVREDLKKVVNNKQFKQHCDMLGTSYYKYFLEAAQVASRLSRDMAMTQHTQSGWAKAQKVFASSAISLRVSTALKQLLSAPAFMVYSLDPVFQHELIKTVEPIDIESAIKGLKELVNGNTQEAKKLLLNENWVGHYNWCVKNLPSFRERVSKRGAGNPILEERGFSRFSDDIQAVGMLPNRLVDAFTCSVGAKAIYEYTYKKFKKNYDDKTAHNMAVTEAEIAFNTSQQSSNPVFLAPMQASKQFFLRGMMNYKNSPIGYYRNAMKANIDLYRATKALFGQPKFVINGEEKVFESGGKKAISKAAEAAAKSMMFNFFLNAIWNFGTIGIAGLSYKVFGNSNDEGSNPFYTDEEIKKVTGDNMALYLAGSAIQGIPWFSGFLNAAQTGQEYTPSILFSELNEWTDQVSKDGIISMATAQFVAGVLLKGGAGIDPEVWGQIYRGAQGIMADRPMRAEDFMNLIASPRSAISGVAKQKVSQYDNLQGYVDSRIESEREIGANETLTFGKRLTGLRKLKKSKLDGYIDEYLADKIPDYREIANKPDEMAKKEKQERTNMLMNAYSVQDYEKEKESKRKDKNGEEYDSHTEDVLKKVRKAVNVIHKIYAFGDTKSAQRIADELERRIKRGYNADGATLDERLKSVDIYDSTGTTEQRSQDGFDTLFDRAMLGGFNKTYLGNDRLD